MAARRRTDQPTSHTTGNPLTAMCLSLYVSTVRVYITRCLLLGTGWRRPRRGQSARLKLPPTPNHDGAEVTSERLKLSSLPPGTFVSVSQVRTGFANQPRTNPMVVLQRVCGRVQLLSDGGVSYLFLRLIQEFLRAESFSCHSDDGRYQWVCCPAMPFVRFLEKSSSFRFLCRMNTIKKHILTFRL